MNIIRLIKEAFETGIKVDTTEQVKDYSYDNIKEIHAHKKPEYKIKCVKCEEDASEGSMIHPYCKKHYMELFNGDIKEYNYFLLTKHK